MKILFLFLLLTFTPELSSQNSYFLPYPPDTTAKENENVDFYSWVKDAKYDFSSMAKPLSLDKKMLLFRDAIILNNIEQTQFLTKFKSFEEFNSCLHSYELYPAPFRIQQINDNLFFLDYDNDGACDVIFDDYIPQHYDMQSIYIAKSDSGTWRKIDIDGFIITNAQFIGKKLFSIDTYSWACCNEPFDKHRTYYYKDSLGLQYSTAIAAYSEKTRLLNKKNAKAIKIINDYAKIYSIKNNMVYEAPDPLEPNYHKLPIMAGNFGYAYGEIEINNQNYVFVEIRIKETKLYGFRFDRVLGWIKKSDVVYEK